MMDLWATVPYYTAYLSKALIADGVDVMVGSITYYLDPECFTSRGIKVDPGLLDVVGKFNLPVLPRARLENRCGRPRCAATRHRGEAQADVRCVVSIGRPAYLPLRSHPGET